MERAIYMDGQRSACLGHECDCYQRGFADARRTVEAEFAAERAVLAMLASSLADAGGDLRIAVHPADAQHFDFGDASPVDVDMALLPGSVRLVSDVADRIHQVR